MAGKLVWSPEAAEDIQAIAEYIERDSIHYARAVLSRIVSLVEDIPERPHLGRKVPELSDPQYRERFVHRFRIIYKLETNRILLVAVIHGSRDLSPLANEIRSVQEI